MRSKLRLGEALSWLGAGLMLLACGHLEAQAAELKLQTQLIWGTDDSKPPEGKDYKPVEPVILKKLKELPLKWKNYFEVKRTDFTVTSSPFAVRSPEGSLRFALRCSRSPHATESSRG